MKHGHFGNIEQFSSLSLCLDCATYKLGKNKSLHFSMHGIHAIKCFEIIHYDVWGVIWLFHMLSTSIL